MKLNNELRNKIRKRQNSYSYADILNEETLDLDEGLVSSFSQLGQEQIQLAQNDKREINKYRPSLIDKIANGFFSIDAKRTNGDYFLSAVKNETRLIKNLQRSKRFIAEVFDSYKNETSERLKLSLIIAAFRQAHKFPDEILEFLEWASENSSIELREWSNMLIQELASSATSDLKLLSEPVSERDFEYDPNGEFDVTMPLVFSGVAYAKIGFVTKSIPIPPLMFESIIGKAMALVRDESFENRMVLQKTMYGIHPDGSPHYEIFPFLGSTAKLEENVYKHNYRTEVSRPYYTSGVTEHVGHGDHVIKGVTLSFDRVGMTTTPEKYRTNNKRLVETVRGTFFGYGNVNINSVIRNGFKLDNGEFQLTPKINPYTNKESNTLFKGIFYGKVTDNNGDNKLDVNTIPVNCDRQGNLDYFGDKSLSKEKYRPEDW